MKLCEENVEMFRGMLDQMMDGMYQKEKEWFDAAVEKADTTEELVKM